MNNEKSGCIIDSWFSNAKRMGLAALVCAFLAIISFLPHSFLAFTYGKSSLVSGVSMIMSFVFIAGFAVAFAIFLILSVERRLRK